MFTRERLTRWTNALRANPQKQHKSSLANSDFSKLCCLGELCEVEGLGRYRTGFIENECTGFIENECTGFIENGLYTYSALHSDWQLTKDFGNKHGYFTDLNMPLLHYLNTYWPSATSANDAGVPWPVIADHFDMYYPCADEQR